MPKYNTPHTSHPSRRAPSHKLHSPNTASYTVPLSRPRSPPSPLLRPTLLHDGGQVAVFGLGVKVQPRRQVLRAVDGMNGVRRTTRVWSKQLGTWCSLLHLGGWAVGRAIIPNPHTPYTHPTRIHTCREDGLLVGTCTTFKRYSSKNSAAAGVAVPLMPDSLP